MRPLQGLVGPARLCCPRGATRCLVPCFKLPASMWHGEHAPSSSGGRAWGLGNNVPASDTRHLTVVAYSNQTNGVGRRSSTSFFFLIWQSGSRADFGNRRTQLLTTRDMVSIPSLPTATSISSVSLAAPAVIMLCSLSSEFGLGREGNPTTSFSL